LWPRHNSKTGLSLLSWSSANVIDERPSASPLRNCTWRLVPPPASPKNHRLRGAVEVFRLHLYHSVKNDRNIVNRTELLVLLAIKRLRTRVVKAPPIKPRRGIDSVRGYITHRILRYIIDNISEYILAFAILIVSESLAHH